MLLHPVRAPPRSAADLAADAAACAHAKISVTHASSDGLHTMSTLHCGCCVVAAALQVYDVIRHEISTGGRAYIVCPLVNESDAFEGARTVQDEFDRLSSSGEGTCTAQLRPQAAGLQHCGCCSHSSCLRPVFGRTCWSKGHALLLLSLLLVCCGCLQVSLVTAAAAACCMERLLPRKRRQHWSASEGKQGWSLVLGAGKLKRAHLQPLI